MIVVVEPNADDYGAGVTSFLASLTWLYLRHRYPVVAQGNLLRVLTLSGLDPWWWERCAAQLVVGHRQAQGLSQLLAPATGTSVPEQFRQAVEEIWAYAAAEAAPVGEPPLAPVDLTAYGYTRVAYVADLQQVYGRSVDERFQAPWVETSHALQKPLLQPGFVFRQAVAMMGATAGAIERLMGIGAGDGHGNG